MYIWGLHVSGPLSLRYLQCLINFSKTGNYLSKFISTCYTCFTPKLLYELFLGRTRSYFILTTKTETSRASTLFDN